MTIERMQSECGWCISSIQRDQYGEFFFTRRYIGYTKREAAQQYRAEVRERFPNAQ